ncbi:MAG: hypothetical protein MUF71_20615 [Candidatus Kapabacteria bacterium]|jgi:hypothetical protein|nr:hypothetical protein [Candidatus Kapabacteria bacterium]
MALARYSKFIFTFAAVANIFAALLALGAMDLHLQMFYGRLQVQDILLRFYHYNFWFVVLMMGFGYAVIARNPQHNRALILIGAVGKLTVAVSWMLLYTMNEATVMVLGGVVYDGLFGILFLLLYRQIPPPQEITP